MGQAPDDSAAPLFASINNDGGGDETRPASNSLFPSSIYGMRRDFNKFGQRSAAGRGYYGSDDDDDDDDDDDALGLGGPSNYHRTHKALESSTSTVSLHDDAQPPSNFGLEQPAAAAEASGIWLEQQGRPIAGAAEDMGIKPFIPVDFLPRSNADDFVESGGLGDPDVEDHVPPLPLAAHAAPKYDKFWANAYLLCISLGFATSLMIWLVTSGILGGKVPLGDTIYTLIRASWGTLLTDTVVAIFISLVWIFLMKNYAAALIYSSAVLVPVGLVILVIYPNANASGLDGDEQYRALRWSTLVPCALGVLWSAMVYRNSKLLVRSIGMIKLASSILTQLSPAIMYLSAGIVLTFVIITFIWTHMFMRLFLEGHFSAKGTWLLDPKAWVLGAFYILLYLWTWGVVTGIQRSTIAASVSQWYFHRHDFPSVSSSHVVQASVQYSLTAQFGTICFSSFLVLIARLPLLILPRRLVATVQILVYSFFVDASALSLTSPLALVNAVINSQDLVGSAQTISQLRCLDQGYNNPEIEDQNPTWPAYRLAKMLLSAARLLTGLAMGFGAWIHAAVYTNGGSLYGYIVGMLAGFIGWFVLGATEGTLSMIMDAAFVCFALDSQGKGGHCQEADRQFGGDIRL